MTSREELLNWVEGNNAYQKADFKTALNYYTQVGVSKTVFNMGMVYLNKKDYDNAEIAFNQAVVLDSHFAAAYFQKGLCLFMLYEYEAALENYTRLLKLLLENDFIDYEQLGFKFKLYRCEVLFNIALCYQELSDSSQSSRYLSEAKQSAKTSEQQSRTDLASRGRMNELNPFSVPLDCICGLTESKMKNLKKKEYLKDAKLVLSDNRQDDGFIGFAGAEIINPELNNIAGTLVRKKETAPAIPEKAPVVMEKVAKSTTLGRSRTPASSNSGSTGKYARKSSLPTGRLMTNPSTPPPMPTIRQDSPKSSPRPRQDSPQSSPRGRMDSPPSESTRTIGRRTVRRNSGNDSGFDEGKIKLKIHTDKGNIIYHATPQTYYEDVLAEVCKKLSLSKNPTLTFMEDDDPDTMVSIFDQDDFILALDSGNGHKVTHLYMQKEADDLLDFY